MAEYPTGGTAEYRARAYIERARVEDAKFESDMAWSSLEERVHEWIRRAGGRWSRDREGTRPQPPPPSACPAPRGGSAVQAAESAAECGLEEWLRYDSHVYGLFRSEDLDEMAARMADPNGHWKPPIVRSARYKRLLSEAYRRGDFWGGEITRRAGPMWDSPKREAWEVVEGRLLKEAMRRSMWWVHERNRRAHEDAMGVGADDGGGGAGSAVTRWEAEMIAVQAELDRRWPTHIDAAPAARRPAPH